MRLRRFPAYFLGCLDEVIYASLRQIRVREFVITVRNPILNDAFEALAPENAFVEPEIRQLIFGRRQAAYRALFTIAGNEIRVLHIRRATRDWATPDDLSTP